MSDPCPATADAHISAADQGLFIQLDGQLQAGPRDNYDEKVAELRARYGSRAV